jgi:hypothetical protein
MSELSMNIDKRWLLLLAVVASSAAAAAVTFTSRRRRQDAENDPASKADLKTWENEGGNLAPAEASPVLP